MSEVNPVLRRHWASFSPSTSEVLVPLCGKTHDLEWLAGCSGGVHGVEFVRQAIEEFFAERAAEPQHRQLANGEVFSVPPLHLYCADFFALSAEDLPACDRIYDRAALVALAPDTRRKYLEKLHSLSGDEARLLLVNFVHNIGSGPPFSITEAELTELSDGLFELQLQEDQDIFEPGGRFAERGATFIREQVWFGRRL